MERTQGRGVDYAAIDEDAELIQQIYGMAAESGEEVADYYDDLNEDKAQKLVLMLI